MTFTHIAARPPAANDPVIDWLLHTDRSIRCKVMRDLIDTRYRHTSPFDMCYM
jgi:hypothetical protein